MSSHRVVEEEAIEHAAKPSKTASAGQVIESMRVALLALSQRIKPADTLMLNWDTFKQISDLVLPA